MSPPPFDIADADLGWLRRVAQSLVADENDAEDLVQESWLTARDRPPADGAVTPGWLATVMRNRWRLRLRRRGRQRSREERVARSEVIEEAHLLERLEVAERVLTEIKSLSPQYRDVVLYRYHWDLTPNEIAEQLDVPVATVHSRLLRAHDQLRARLQSRFDGDVRFALVPLLIGPKSATSVSAAITMGGLIGMKKLVVLIAGIVLLLVGWLAYPLWVGEPAAPDAPLVSAPPTTPAETPTTKTDEPVAAEDAGTLDTAKLVVTVVDAVTGAPLAGARFGTEPLGARFGHTDTDGRIELRVKNEPGPFDAAMVVSLDGYVTQTIRPFVVPDRVRLQPGFELTGIVVDSGGAAVPGARVAVLESPEVGRPQQFGYSHRPVSRMYQARGAHVLRADATGRFRTWTASTTAAIHATDAQHSPGATDLLVRTDRFPDVTVVLGPPQILRGRVVDDAGAGVAGATIVCYTQPESRAPDHFYETYSFKHEGVSGDDGEFEIPGVGPTHVKLRVRHPRFMAFQYIGNSAHPTLDPVTIELSQGTRIAGHFRVSNNGVIAKRGFVHPGRWGVAALDIDSDGRFESEVLPANAESFGTVRVPGYVPVSVDWQEAQRAASGDSEAIADPKMPTLFELGDVVLDSGARRTVLVVDGAGEPQPGQWVRLSTAKDSGGQWIWGDRQITNSAGTCEFSGLPSGMVQVALYGRVTMPPIELDLSQSPDVIRVVAPATASIVGVLVDSGARPVPGAQVVCSYSNQPGGSRWVQTYTVADGRFQLSDLPAGRSLTITTRGSGCPELRFVVEPLAMDEQRDVGELTAGGERRVRGVVQDQEQQPVADATVILSGGNGRPSYFNTTDRQGRFQFDGLVDGSSSLSVSAVGYVAGYPQSITLAGVDVEDRVVTMTATRPFEGRVVDDVGNPISGAGIILPSQHAQSWSSGEQVLTDEAGRYQHPSAPVRDIQLVVLHADYPRTQERYANLDEIPDPLVVTRGATLEVTFTTPEGTFDEQPRLQLMKGRLSQHGSTSEVVPDLAATHRLRGLEAGEWQLQCTVRGRPPIDPRPVTLVAGDVTRIEIALGALARPVTLRVVGTDGQPVAAARVAQQDHFHNGSGNYPTTDENGELVLSEGIERSGPVLVVAKGYAEAIATHADIRNDRVELRLQPESVIELRVVTPGGEAVAGVTVFVESWSLGDRRMWSPEVSGGTLRLTSLAPGTFDITLNRDGRGIGHFDVALGPAETRELVLELPEPFTVTGRVSLGGSPVASGSVTVSQSWRGEASADVGSDGRFVVELFGPGEYAVGYHTPEKRHHYQRLRIDGPDDLDLDFSSATLTGVVLDPTGEPVPGVTGYFTPLVTAQRAVRFTTGSDGRFALEDVPRGVYSWDARWLPEAVDGQHLYGPRYRIAVDGSADLVLRLEAARPIEFSFVGGTPEKWQASYFREDRAEPTRRGIMSETWMRWPASATSGVLTADGFAPASFTIGEASTVEIALTPGGRLEVLTLDSDGVRRPSTAFRVQPAPGIELEPALRRHRTDSDGAKVLYLAPGSYDVILGETDDPEAIRQSVTIEVAGSTRVTLPSDE